VALRIAPARRRRACWAQQPTSWQRLVTRVERLVLNATTGAITGTPHAADVGTYPITVKVTDQYGDTATSGPLSIAITAPTITFPSSLGGGTVGTAYSASAAATGALGTTTYVLASGSLPASNDLV